jgi:hypothetical protein
VSGSSPLKRRPIVAALVESIGRTPLDLVVGEEAAIIASPPLAEYGEEWATHARDDGLSRYQDRARSSTGRSSLIS